VVCAVCVCGVCVCECVCDVFLGVCVRCVYVGVRVCVYVYVCVFWCAACGTVWSGLGRVSVQQVAYWWVCVWVGVCVCMWVGVFVYVGGCVCVYVGVCVSASFELQ